MHVDSQVYSEEETTTPENAKTTILISNVPASADEEILELLFESKKKGGGPVKHVQLNRQKEWAIIEFCEPGAVEALMSKLPITLMGTELEIHPHTPLISGGVLIHNLEIRGVPKQLTDDLTTKNVENTIGSAEASSAEYESDEEYPEPKAEITEDNYTVILKNLKTIQLKLLTVLKFQESIVEKFPNVTVDINLENNEVRLQGNNADTQLAKMNLYETLSTYVTHVFDDISEGALELYQSKRVVEYINTKLASENLERIVWEIKDGCLLVCGVREDVIKCTGIIRETVKEEKFPISKESAAVFWSTQWQNKLTKLRKDTDVFCEVKSSGNVIHASVIAASDKVAELAGKVKTFLRKQSNVRSETINVQRLGKIFSMLKDNADKLDDDIWYYFVEKLISKIESDLSKHYVSVDFSDFEDIKITGTAEGRDLAKKRLKTINLGK